MTNPLFDESTIAALSEPFHPMFVEWKPQATTKDGKRALAAAYIDARHYQYRLDTVVPGWETSYEFIKPDGSLVKCRLTIAGVSREEVGESDPGEENTATSAVAQSFKRACAAFGLGRYLYFLPQVWCDYDPQARRITTPPTMPAWAKPGGGGYPLAAKKNGRPQRAPRNGASTDAEPTAQHDEPVDADGDPVGQESPENGGGWMSYDEAASVIFTLKPKSRPELAGKTLGEVAEQAPDILTWLADQYTPTPDTQQLKDAARVLAG